MGCVAKIFPSYLLKLPPNTSTWICTCCRYMYLKWYDKRWIHVKNYCAFSRKPKISCSKSLKGHMRWQAVCSFDKSSLHFCQYYVSTYVMLTEWFKKFRNFHTKTLACSTGSRNLSFKWMLASWDGPPCSVANEN